MYRVAPKPRIIGCSDEVQPPVHVAFHEWYKPGTGPTADIAVSNYYAVNNRAQPPHPGEGYLYHPHITHAKEE